MLQIVAGLAFLPFILSKLTKGYRITENSADMMMFGLLASIGMSHVSHLWFGGAWTAMGMFLPSFIGYFLVVHTMDSQRKIEGLFSVLILCTFAIAAAGIFQYHSDSPIARAKILTQREYDGNGNIVGEIRRIRWLGPFADPNDLAIAFILVLPLLMHRILNGKYLLAGLSILPITYALYLTNSRGAALALAVAVATFFVIRSGKIKGILIAAFVVGLMVLFGPSRLENISVGEASFHGRLDAWYEGFQILKQNPVFGSGAMTFTDFHDITAHNSLVLVFSELGLFGAFFFIGIFFIPIEMALTAVYCGCESSIKAQEKKAILTAVIASLAGIIVSMLFLSRSYTFLPYLICGMVVAGSRTIGLPDAESSRAHIRPSLIRFARNIALAEIGTILFVNLLLKVLLWR